jgi:hypothetical protein
MNFQGKFSQKSVALKVSPLYWPWLEHHQLKNAISLKQTKSLYKFILIPQEAHKNEEPS